MKLSPKKKEDFQKMIWDFYRKNKRDGLVWRKGITPYKIWVSEIMLQQTQVDRVIPFFKNWMKLFPNVKKLASASQVDVLRAWKGLGYNSRALRMKKTAEIISKQYNGIFPETYEEILELPGIGPYTAGAIVSFAYDKPVAMIETNIRRVYLHHFYPSVLAEPRTAPLSKGSQGSDSVLSTHCLPLLRGGGRRPEGCGKVHDQDLIKIISVTVDHKHPREWYWALMDYGSHLGKTIPNPNKKSRHYTIQKQFKGSDREIRGSILSILLEQKKISIETMIQALESLTTDHDRIEKIIDRLDQEEFLEIKKGWIFLKK